jgi:hypothetical protein
MQHRWQPDCFTHHAGGRSETFMKAVLNIVCLVCFITLCSCAPARFAFRPNDATEGAIVAESKDEPGHLYIIVKSQHALNDTLARLNCGTRPCIIGRLGEVYVVERPEVD